MTWNRLLSRVLLVLTVTIFLGALWVVGAGFLVLAQMPTESERISVNQAHVEALTDRVAKIEASVERMETEKRITKIEGAVAELVERSKASQRLLSGVVLSILGMLGKSVYSMIAGRSHSAVVRP